MASERPEMKIYHICAQETKAKSTDLEIAMAVYRGYRKDSRSIMQLSGTAGIALDLCCVRPLGYLDRLCVPRPTVELHHG